MKNTYENVLEVPEVVINIVGYDIVHQASLASAEYAKGINEFVKAGLTEAASQRVKPPRVGESKISMECKVNEVIRLGEGGAAGNLVICEMLLMHIRDEVLDADGKIDPVKLDAVARMGGDWYCRATGDSLFRLPQPGTKLGIGIDSLPDEIKNSPVFSGTELALLASVEQIPKTGGLVNADQQSHKKAKQLLQQRLIDEAWAVLMPAS